MMNNVDIVAASAETIRRLERKIYEAELHWNFTPGWHYEGRQDGQRLHMMVTTADHVLEEMTIASVPEEAGAEMFAWLKKLHREWRKRNGKLDPDDILPND